RAESAFRRKRQLRAEEVHGGRAVLGGAVKQRSDELLGRIDLGALRIPLWGAPRSHPLSALRAPGSSGLLPSRARLPARSPARRAADEYPADARLACQVPRAFDAPR